MEKVKKSEIYLETLKIFSDAELVDVTQEKNND